MKDFFIREGNINVWDDKKNKMKKRYTFLFNDVMLFTKKEKGKKFWLRVHVSLRSKNCNIEDMPNTNQFRLNCKSRTFIIQAADPQLKKAWVEDISGSISGIHDEKQRVVNRDREELFQKKPIKQKSEPEFNVNEVDFNFENTQKDDDDDKIIINNKVKPQKEKVKTTEKSK